LILPVKSNGFAVGENIGFMRGKIAGRLPFVLPTVDDRREAPAGPSLFIKPRGFDDLLAQPDLIVRVDDCEARFEADDLCVSPEDLRGH